MTSGLPRLSECRDCGDPIRFVRMEDTGRNMPVNPSLNLDHGTVAARYRRTEKGTVLFGFVITRDRAAGPGYPHRFTPHAATCPARRPAPKPAPAPAPTLF